MHISEIKYGDLQKLKEKTRIETNAKQRDRYRAVALALQGWQTKAIMTKLDRSKNFVQRWSYFYRDGGVCVLRGKDVQQILEREFGVKYTLFGVYDLMHRLGFSCLKPRSKHRKNNPEKMQQWLEQAPFLFKKSEQKIPARKLKSGSRTK